MIRNDQFDLSKEDDLKKLEEIELKHKVRFKEVIYIPLMYLEWEE